MRVLHQLGLLAGGYLLALLAGCGTGSPVSSGTAREATTLTVQPSHPFTVRFTAAVAGSRSVELAVWADAYAQSSGAEPLLEAQLPPGQSGPYEVAVPASARWQDPPPLATGYRFTGQSALLGELDSLELPPLPQLVADTLYLVPLRRTATVGETVTYLLLQGAPAEPLDSLRITLSGAAGADYVPASFGLGIARPDPLGGPAGMEGAWGVHSPSVLPLAFGPAGEARQAAPGGAITLEITPGYGQVAPAARPDVAGAGLLCSIGVRFAAPGSYRLTLGNAADCTYCTNRLLGSAGEQRAWGHYATDLAGLDLTVTVE